MKASMTDAGEMFLRFVRPQWRRLHLVARQYVQGEDDARDLVQETLLRAWRRFSPADEQAYRRSWLFVILRNVATDWHRNTRRRIRLTPLDHDELTELASCEPDEPFASLGAMNEQQFREFLDDRLAAALDALEPAFREVIVLSVAGGLTYRESADVLDCPVGTVMSRMARARRILRERLADFARQRGWTVEKQV